jgi:hypothetical protein
MTAANLTLLHVEVDQHRKLGALIADDRRQWCEQIALPQAEPSEDVAAGRQRSCRRLRDMRTTAALQAGLGHPTLKTGREEERFTCSAARVPPVCQHRKELRPFTGIFAHVRVGAAPVGL